MGQLGGALVDDCAHLACIWRGARRTSHIIGTASAGCCIQSCFTAASTCDIGTCHKRLHMLSDIGSKQSCWSSRVASQPLPRAMAASPAAAGARVTASGAAASGPVLVGGTTSGQAIERAAATSAPRTAMTAAVAAAAAADLPDSLGNEVDKLDQRHRELIRERQQIAKDLKKQKQKNQRCMAIARRLDNTTLIEIIAARAATAKAKAKAKATACSQIAFGRSAQCGMRPKAMQTAWTCTRDEGQSVLTHSDGTEQRHDMVASSLLSQKIKTCVCYFAFNKKATLRNAYTSHIFGP